MVVTKLLPHQGAFIQAPYVYDTLRFYFLIAGYASGKSTCLNYALLYAVTRLSGLKDNEGKMPKILVGGISLTFMRKTITGALEQILKNTKTEYYYDKAHNIIEVAGCQLLLVPINDESNIFGYDVCCAFLDELDELPTYESMGIVKSVNDRCRQKIKGFRAPFIAVTTTSQGLKGTYQTVMEFKKSGIPYMIIRGRTRDNIYLPKEYVDSMYKIYNEKETQCLLEGVFISIDSGLVFPDYDPKKNKLDVDLYPYVKEHGLPVYIGQDFNSFGNYAQAYSLFTFSDGRVAIVCIKEYKFPDMRRAPEVFRYDFPNSDILWIPDMTSQNSFSNYKKELKTNNIRIVYRKCNPLVNDRNFACNKLMHIESFYVCPSCKMTDTALMTHQKDPKTGLPMKGGDGAPDHLNDCMGYVVHYLLSWRKELKCLYDVTLGYKYQKRRQQGEEDENNLEVGGYIMDADKLKESPVRGLDEKKHKQKNVDMAVIK